MRSYNGIERPEFTPGWITELKPYADARTLENVCLPASFMK